MLNNEQTNQFLTLFMGECWHEWEQVTVGHDWWRCHLCDDHRYGSYDPQKPPDNNYICSYSGIEIKQLMERDRPVIWEEYLIYVATTISINVYPNTEILNAILNPSNLAQFLVEQREEWEWIECNIFSDAVSGYGCINYTDKECCDDCNREGKIKHKAAKYLDSIKEEA